MVTDLHRKTQLTLKLTQEQSKLGCKDRESIQSSTTPHLTQDTSRKVTNL